MRTFSASVTCASAGAFTADVARVPASVAQFLAQHRGVDSQLLRNLLGQFVAHDAAGDALDVGQQIVHRLLFSVAGTDGKLRPRPFDQIVEIFLRILERGAIGFFALAANVEIGIEALFEGQNFYGEFFFDQQAEGAFGGLRSGRIGIEIHNRILAEAPEQLGLQFGEGGAGTGDHVLESGGVDGDAIHLTFDQDGVVEFPDPFLGEVEIEQDLAFGIDLSLGGVQVFRAGFFVGGEGASGEGDDFSGFARDGEHDAVAEFGIHRRWSLRSLVVGPPSSVVGRRSSVVGVTTALSSRA